MMVNPEIQEKITTQYTRDVFNISAIHKGGIGDVCISTIEKEEKDYALKTISMCKNQPEEERKKTIQQLRWESMVGLALGKHQNIVQFLWFDHDQFYNPILILENIERDPHQGETLRNLINRLNSQNKKLSLSSILKIAIEVVTAFLYIKRILKEEYGAHFIYRELKAENIFITREGVTKLLVKHEIQTKDNSLFTQAPFDIQPHSERLRDEATAEKKNSYALGCILYEMISGSSICKDLLPINYNPSSLNNTPQLPQKKERYILNRLHATILNCLNKDATYRPTLVKLRKNLQNFYRVITGEKLTVYNEEEKLTSEEWTLRGIGFSNLGIYRRAIPCYDEAITLDPENARAYHNRGVAFRKIGQYELAVKDHTKAIDLNPNYTFAYTSRGNAYYALGLRREALKDHTQALNIDPNYTTAYSNRGNVYEELKDYKQAIDDYTKVIELNPINILAYFNRGKTYSHIGKHENALKDFKQSRALKQKYAIALGSFHNTDRSYSIYSPIEDCIGSLELELRIVNHHNNKKNP